MKRCCLNAQWWSSNAIVVLMGQRSTIFLFHLFTFFHSFLLFILCVCECVSVLVGKTFIVILRGYFYMAAIFFQLIDIWKSVARREEHKKNHVEHYREENNVGRNLKFYSSIFFVISFPYWKGNIFLFACMIQLIFSLQQERSLAQTFQHKLIVWFHFNANLNINLCHMSSNRDKWIDCFTCFVRCG